MTKSLQYQGGKFAFYEAGCSHTELLQRGEYLAEQTQFSLENFSHKLQRAGFYLSLLTIMNGALLHRINANLLETKAPASSENNQCQACFFSFTMLNPDTPYMLNLPHMRIPGLYGALGIAI